MSMHLLKSGVLLAALALSACQAKSGDGAQSADPSAKAAAGGAAGCHAYQAGKDQVIRTFCDGPGAATFTIGSTSAKLGGGSCEHLGQMFSFNAGVVTLPGSASPPPDYVGLSVPGTGDFKGGILALRYGGKSWGSTDIHGRVTAAGGTFEGPVHASGGSAEQGVVKGSFTC